MDSPARTHFVLIFLMLLIAANLFILDLHVFAPPQSTIKISDISTTNTTILTPTLSYVPPTLTPSMVTIQHSTTQAHETMQREFIIPLGSGTTSKQEWTDLTGTDTLIDGSLYPARSEMTLMVSLRNPTQNGIISVRLYNVTDKHPVWQSDLSMNGPIYQTLTSSPLTLESSTKLYRIQMKSSLAYEATLENAKLRIVTL